MLKIESKGTCPRQATPGAGQAAMIKISSSALCLVQQVVFLPGVAITSVQVAATEGTLASAAALHSPAPGSIDIAMGGCHARSYTTAAHILIRLCKALTNEWNWTFRQSVSRLWTTERSYTTHCVCV